MNSADDDDQPLIVEAGGIKYVSAEHRHGSAADQFTIRFSPVLYLAPIFLGGAAIPKGLGLIGSCVAIVSANVFGSIAAAMCAAMGPKRGMPQLVMGRSSFGYIGNFLPAVCATLLFIGYFSVGTIVGAKPIASMTGLPYTPLVLVVGSLSILLAVFGYNLLHLTGRWVTNAGLILLVVTTGFMIYHGTGESVSTLSGLKYAFEWLSFFSLIFSFTVSWMLYASDYSRYLPERTSSAKVFGYAFGGLVTGSTWMMCLGASLATIGTGGALEGLVAALPPAVLWIVLLSLIITSITHNSINLYSCSMACLTWDFPVKRRYTVVISGIIGTIMAVMLGGSNFIENFSEFLNVMAYFMCPWLAIILIDYFRNGSSQQADAFYEKEGPYSGVLWRGMLSFLLAILASTPFMANAVFVGPVASLLGGADTSYFVSFLAAGTLYFIIGSIDRSGVKRSVQINTTL